MELNTSYSSNPIVHLCNTTLQQLPNKDWNLFFGVFISLVSVCAVSENGFILLLFCKYPILCTPSNKILLSVVSADFLIGFASGPLYASQLLSASLNNHCLIHTIRRGFSVVLMGASLTSIVMLTIDRYKNLTNMRNYTMQKKWLFIGLSICWCLPILGAFLGTISNRVHSAIVSIVGVCVIIVILVCYVMVIIALKRHRINSLNKRNPIYMKNERKAAETVIIIITCFLLMLLPLFIEKGLASFKVLTKNTPTASLTHMFAISLYIANGMINPIIYAGRLPSIKKCTYLFCSIDRRTESRSCTSSSTSAINVAFVDVSNTSLTVNNVPMGVLLL